MTRVPLWVVGGLLVLSLLAVASGEAKFGTEGSCEDWIEDKAVEAANSGEPIPNGYQFWGLGIGFCVAN